MAGIVSWTFQFQGLDQNIAKLKVMDALLNGISRKGGILGGAGGINVGGQGGTTFIGGVPSGTGRGSNAATTAGAAALGAGVGARASAGVAGTSMMGAASLNAWKQATNNYPIPKWIDKEGTDRIKQGFIRFTGKLDAAGMHLFEITKLGQMHLNPDMTFNKERTVPPIIGPMGNNHLRESSTLRNIRAAGIRMGRGTGEMAGNGPMGASLAASGLSKLLGPVGLIISSFLILHSVTKLLIEGIKQGAEAYQHAAKLGMGVGATFQTSQAFKAIGMESPDLSVLQGQFNPQAKKYGVPDTDMILGAARAGQFGNVQQLTNMADEFRKAMQEGEQAARQMGAAAKANQATFQQTSAISREWHVMWAQIAADIQPVIKIFQGLILGFLKIMNKILEWYIIIGKFLHLLPNDTGNFSHVGGQMGKSGPTFASWEKMGFIFNQKGGPEKHLQNIATNTAQTVKSIDGLAKSIGIMTGAKVAGNVFGMTPLVNFP